MALLEVEEAVDAFDSIDGRRDEFFESRFDEVDDFESRRVDELDDFGSRFAFWNACTKVVWGVCRFFSSPDESIRIIDGD